MKKTIIALSILIVGISISIVVYFSIINPEKTISIVSKDKKSTLSLGTYKVNSYRERRIVVYADISFRVKKIEEFKNNVKLNEHYLDIFSNDKIYVYRIDNNYFSVNFYGNYVELSLMYSYWAKEGHALFTFPNKSGVSSLFDSMDEDVDLKIPYAYMMVDSFDKFKEFYKNFDPLTCRIKDGNTVQLKGYDYYNDELNDNLIIEFKSDTDGIIANWSRTSDF